jgi:hypothetical protein
MPIAVASTSTPGRACAKGEGKVSPRPEAEAPSSTSLPAKRSGAMAPSSSVARGCRPFQAEHGTALRRLLHGPFGAAHRGHGGAALHLEALPFDLPADGDAQRADQQQQQRRARFRLRVVDGDAALALRAQDQGGAVDEEHLHPAAGPGGEAVPEGEAVTQRQRALLPGPVAPGFAHELQHPAEGLAVLGPRSRCSCDQAGGAGQAQEGTAVVSA